MNIKIDDGTITNISTTNNIYNRLSSLIDIDPNLTPVNNSILLYDNTSKQWVIGTRTTTTMGGSYVISVNGKSDEVFLNTDDITEGTTNKYYTDARVSSNTDVAANTAKRHDAVTVTDSSEIDLTLTGQDITASIKPASIDETKLDTSINTSLGLANTSVQPGDNISSLTNDSNFINSSGVNYTNLYMNNAIGTTASTVAAGDDSRFHNPVTLSGTPNYLTLTGQNITLGLIDLSNDVTGTLDSRSLPSNLGIDNITQITNRSHTDLTDIGTNTHVQIDSHISDTTNPHNVTKAQIGLANVPNIDTSNASNITTGTLSSSILPPIALTTTSVVSSEANQLALSSQEGDVVIRTDINKTYIHNNGTTGTMSDWTEIITPTSNSVTSVNSYTGTVILNQDDIGNGTTYVQTHNDFNNTLLDKLNNIEANAEINNISDTDATNLTSGNDTNLHYHSADRDRANHTGTQLASTISDFDSRVSANTDVANNTSFTTTPSSVITAGTNLSWDGNTLNASGATNLTDINDVTLTSVNDKDILSYDLTTSKWINKSNSLIKTDLSLDNVENTAISTWAGSSNITTVGTITSGLWNGSKITDDYINSSTTWNNKLTNVVDDTTPELGGELNAGAHSIGFTLQELTGVAGTTNIDWTLGNKCKFTFGAGNETLTFTDPSNPCSLVLMIVQDSVGNRVINWPANIKWVNSILPTLSTAANGVDIITLFYDGMYYYGGAALAFS